MKINKSKIYASSHEDGDRSHVDKLYRLLENGELDEHDVLGELLARVSDSDVADLLNRYGFRDNEFVDDDALSLGEDLLSIADHDNVDVTTVEQLGNDYMYRKLVKSVRDAERFNYHSDYWGSADDYQRANVKLMKKIAPFIGKTVVLDFGDDARFEANVLGLLIDTQYNDIEHSAILVEEV